MPVHTLVLFSNTFLLAARQEFSKIDSRIEHAVQRLKSPDYVTIQWSRFRAGSACQENQEGQDLALHSHLLLPEINKVILSRLY
jgi:hypothetical protein